MPKRAVVAIGGNSLIKDAHHQTVADQYAAVGETVGQIMPLVAAGWEVVITHGNGPQVGFILRRSELAARELHEVPLDVCGADTQGAIGYMIQQHCCNEFRRLGLRKHAVAVVTQTEVAADDPAFTHPTKPIGSFMDAATARRRQEHDGWTVVEDAGRGWRRVVPSPVPVRIVEEAAIRLLVEAGYVVIATGGGGIPVVADAEGQLHGTAAVIDKDLASSLLATRIGADLFVITTAVDRVALNFGRPNQREIERMDLVQARAYLAEGVHFGAGSMAPKIAAVIGYLERGGREAVITRPEHLERALAGQTGTRITRDEEAAA